MAIEIKTPTFPESIADGTVAAWHRAVDEPVRRDDVLVDIETDKVVIEVPAPADGRLVEILKSEGDVVLSEEPLGRFEAGVAAPVAATAPAATPEAAAVAQEAVSVSPAARKLAAEAGIDPATLAGTGRDGRVIKEDVQRAIGADTGDDVTGAVAASVEAAEEGGEGEEGRVERRVPMTRLRATIAHRLVEAQRTTAMLTTFNEVDMAPVMTMRQRYGEEFQQRHNGTRLGLMCFFVRAAVESLKRFPAVNASIDGDDVLYHGYYDIGVAVSTDRGLVVPVIRNADALGLHQIEDAITDFGVRARDNKLEIAEISGGTFTISNGGVFGSLLSTPILNPPQTAILGMHKIQDRPMVIDGEIVVRPMMYLALSYDHRLIDGRDAVRFLVTMKELVEDPARILLEL